MAPSRYTRRSFSQLIATAPLWPVAAKAAAASPRQAIITKFGAVADDKTINTKAIQAAIDDLAAHGGGTVIVPKGVFVSGALFFKPKVNLHLEKDAVIKCTTEMENFPQQRTRIEGHFEPKFTPALINASGCDGFHISGEGTFDGAGKPIWEEFWRLRRASPQGGNFPNIGLPRARLALLENSRNVIVEGVTFKDSQFWNLHIYKCDGVTVRNAKFLVPDDYKQAPSTDGIDLDSCRNVTVDGCYFSVTDDCIAAKGSKGVHALEDRDSPPVEHIRIRNCTYKRGNGCFTIGSEATLVRDVVVENCKIVGNVKVATIKLRPDTPQHYEDITFRNITSEGHPGVIIQMQPWTQYFNLQGAEPPKSMVRNLSLIGIKGTFESFGVMKPNPGQTDISGVLLKDFDVTLTKDKLDVAGVNNLKYENVIVNGQKVTG